MSTTAHHPLAAIGSESIPGESPCGENARYEPEFEQLEAELAKQESLTSATVDWAKIVDVSSQIIHEKSKDILVGSYLCYGLLLKEGYQGLAVGLKILFDMADQHWDCLFPPAKRMRARQTAFVWLAEKAALTISEKTPTASESEVVIEAMEYLKQLDSTLVDKMGDQAPLLTELSRPLKNYTQSAQAEQAKAAQVSTETAAAAAVTQPQPATQQPAPAKVEQASPATAPQPGPASAATSIPGISTGSLESEADSKKILRQIQSASRDLSSFWLGQKLSDPRAFRINRVAAWIMIENVPPANEGVTQINPPPVERLKFFDTKMESGDFSGLLPELEKTLARAPFWLDGQFLAVKTLRAMGAEYQNALQAVINETAGFLKRLPGLVELAFSDQTPFASDQTRLWIDSEVMTSADPAQPGATAPGQTGEDWDNALADASKMAAAGESKSALGLMNQGLKRAGSLRSQMYWRCALAQLLLQTGQAAAASQILEQLATQLKKSKIQYWEPALAALTYTLLFQSYQKQQKKNKDDDSLKEKVARAYAKLCWFDPVTALSVKGG